MITLGKLWLTEGCFERGWIWTQRKIFWTILGSLRLSEGTGRDQNTLQVLDRDSFDKKTQPRLVSCWLITTHLADRLTRAMTSPDH